MQLTLSLIPLYLAGNLHCFGMCGPLVMMIGQNPFRMYYYLGRILAFSIAGGLSGSLGFLLKGFLGSSSGIFSVGVGLFLILLSINQIRPSFLHVIFEWKGFNVIHWMMSEKPFPIFLFGLSTVLLPCGQTLIVFATLALTESWWIGLFNGFIFAVLTTPSLLLAMNIKKWGMRWRAYPKWIAFATAFLIGVITLNRGLSDLELIPHLTLSENYHIILW